MLGDLKQRLASFFCKEPESQPFGSVNRLAQRDLCLSQLNPQLTGSFKVQEVAVVSTLLSRPGCALIKLHLSFMYF